MQAGHTWSSRPGRSFVGRPGEDSTQSPGAYVAAGALHGEAAWREALGAPPRGAQPGPEGSRRRVVAAVLGGASSVAVAVPPPDLAADALAVGASVALASMASPSPSPTRNGLISSDSSSSPSA